MGRLIPIFEDTGRGKHFQGKFRDEEHGTVGYLETISPTGAAPLASGAEVANVALCFVARREDQE